VLVILSFEREVHQLLQLREALAIGDIWEATMFSLVFQSNGMYE